MTESPRDGVRKGAGDRPRLHAMALAIAAGFALSAGALAAPDSPRPSDSAVPTTGTPSPAADAPATPSREARQQELEAAQRDLSEAYGRLYRQFRAKPDMSDDERRAARATTLAPAQARMDQLFATRLAQERREISGKSYAKDGSVEAVSGPSGVRARVPAGAPQPEAVAAPPAAGPIPPAGPLRPEFTLDGKDVPREIEFGPGAVRESRSPKSAN